MSDALVERLEDLKSRVRNALDQGRSASDEDLMREYTTYLETARSLYPDKQELAQLWRLPDEHPSLAITIFRDPLAGLRAADSAVSRLLAIVTTKDRISEMSAAAQAQAVGYDVFLSHSAADDVLAGKITEFLQASNISVFCTPGSIESGKWEPAVEAALKGARHLFVLLTPAALMASTWVHQEFGYFFGFQTAGDPDAEMRLHYLELQSNAQHPGMYAHFQATPVSSFDDPSLVARLVARIIGKPFSEPQSLEEPAGEAMQTPSRPLEILLGASGSFEQYDAYGPISRYHLFRIGVRNNLTDRSIEDFRLELNSIAPGIITFLPVPLIRMHDSKLPREEAIAKSYNVNPGQTLYFDVVALIEPAVDGSNIELRFSTLDLPNGVPVGNYVIQLLATGRNVQASTCDVRVAVDDNGSLLFTEPDTTMGT